MNQRVLKYNILIFLGACVLFIPFLGAVHLFDWDEINFAECAREMLVTGDYYSVKINFEPFWEKPPLFIWMQVFSMKIFGINAFAARFPNAICGITTLLLLFNIGRKFFNVRMGLVWVFVYAGSLLPHFYFKSGIIDPWFNLFIFTGVYYFILFSREDVHVNPKKNRQLLLSALFIGLAVLTKGPVAALIFGVCFFVYWIIKRGKTGITIKQMTIYVATVAIVGGLWFFLLFITGNAGIINEFFQYQARLFNTRDAGHGGPFYYHALILLVGCFPMSIFALRSFKKNTRDSVFEKHFKLWMMILFWVVLILFSIVKTKIVHYSSLCYFPLSFLGAYVVYKLVYGELPWKKITGILIMVMASLIGILMLAASLLSLYQQRIIDAGFIRDSFVVENLKTHANWNGIEWITGALLITGTAFMLLWARRQKIKKTLVGIFVISGVSVNLATLFITPRIEEYSQAAAIEFYQSLQGKDCYVETIGFKSYAHLFYFQKKEPGNINSYNREWLLNGAIDKPAYFVCKITSLDNITRDHPDLKELYRKNGFVFLLRSQ